MKRIELNPNGRLCLFALLLKHHHELRLKHNRSSVIWIRNHPGYKAVQNRKRLWRNCSDCGERAMTNRMKHFFKTKFWLCPACAKELSLAKDEITRPAILQLGVPILAPSQSMQPDEALILKEAIQKTVSGFTKREDELFNLLVTQSNLSERQIAREMKISGSRRWQITSSVKRKLKRQLEPPPVEVKQTENKPPVPDYPRFVVRPKYLHRQIVQGLYNAGFLPFSTVRESWVKYRCGKLCYTFQFALHATNPHLIWIIGTRFR